MRMAKSKPSARDIMYFHYCYLIVDTTNGMKYFGVRSSEVAPESDGKYMGSGTKITAAIKEKGKSKFRKEIVAVFDTRDEAMEFEEDYIVDNDVVDSPMYYNVSAKSTGGRMDYHYDLKDGHTSSPQEKNGAQKNYDTDFQKKAKAGAASGIPQHDDHSLRKDGTPDGRIANPEGKMGGTRPGAGRPRGTKALYTKKSAKRLEELGIDPMEELVRTYVQVCEDIENTRSISARTSLYNTRQKIMSDLMRYGYMAQPRENKQEIEVKETGPMSIVLTDQDDKDDTVH